MLSYCRGVSSVAGVSSRKVGSRMGLGRRGWPPQRRPSWAVGGTGSRQQSARLELQVGCGGSDRYLTVGSSSRSGGRIRPGHRPAKQTGDFCVCRLRKPGVLVPQAKRIQAARYQFPVVPSRQEVQITCGLTCLLCAASPLFGVGASVGCFGVD